MALLRLVTKPAKGAILWTGAGAGAAYLAPPLLQQGGYLASSAIGATAMWGGAVAVLLPLGIARGLADGLLGLVARGQPAVRAAVDQASTATTTDKKGVLLTDESARRILEQATGGTGARGKAIRFLASPVLPSTAQTMTRLREVLDQQTQATDGAVVAAAMGGFLEGFLLDKKDTATGVGILAYLLVLGAGYGADRAYVQWYGEPFGAAAVPTPPPEEKETGAPAFVWPKVPSTAGEWIDAAFGAGRVLGDAAEETTRRSTELWESLRQNEDLQKRLEETRVLAEELATRAADSVKEEDLERLAKDAGELLEQAQERLQEEDAQELRRTVEGALQQASDRFLGGGENPKQAPDPPKGWWRRWFG